MISGQRIEIVLSMAGGAGRRKMEVLLDVQRVADGVLEHVVMSCRWVPRVIASVKASPFRGYNSIYFNPGDGGEYVIWDPRRVISMRQVR